jgi:hypothetical protein
MRTYRYLLIGAVMIAILAIGMWLGTKYNAPQIFPTAQAQGIFVNQEQPNQINAAAFTVSQEGDVLYWWQVQNNGLGTVMIFYAGTGNIAVKNFHR